MGYTLQAILFRGETPKLDISPSKLIPLPQGITMLPLTEELLTRIKIPMWELDDLEYILPPPDSLIKFCSALSTNSRLAYIGVEFFGGTGTQANLLFESGKQIAPTRVSEGVGTISEALRFLGVEKNAAYDEFDALELGRVRDTEDWLNLGLS